MRIALVLCSALLISSFAAAPASAETYTGTWMVQPSDSAGMVSLELTYRHVSANNNENWQEEEDVALSQLRGLSNADFDSGGEHKGFAIVRDAGTFRADGWFANHHGSGSWTFEPSSTFTSELARRGVVGLDDRMQFHLAMSDFKVATLDMLLAAGFARPSAQDLTDMIEHGVNEKYISAMRNVPLHPKTVRELINMRDHGVSSSFAAAMMRSDPNLTGEQLVDLRDHGVSAEYMQALAADGYGNISPFDAQRMRDHGVSTSFIEGLHRLGYHPSAEDVVRLADHGVSISFIERMRSHGYTHLSADDLIRLRDHGY